jgi:serine/threonine-protein kinase
LVATPDTLIGTVIDGRFEIRDQLGQGGMGTVYRAWQRSVGREVAIKLIDRTISSDPLAKARFLREAHLASQLSHPNTISVLDSGVTPDGRLFMAMELVRGKTLGRELRAAGAFSLERIVRIGLQLCDALDAAHAHRIVHRDLKLDNVMLLDQGTDLVKVLDFGLAKRLDDQSTQATAAGIVVGTPRYIAPETAMTGDATPASDMYAVGVMLGELALATPLWEGATLSVILQHQLSPEPVIARVPEPLRGVVARLVDPRPQQRPSAAETRKLLELVADGKPLPAPPEERATVDMKRATRDRTAKPASRARTYALIAGGVVVFVGSVLVAYFATRSSHKPVSTPRTPIVATTPGDATLVDGAEDPWTPRYEPALSPIFKEPDPGSYLIRVLNVPRGFVLVVDDNDLGADDHGPVGYEFGVTRGQRVTVVVYAADRKTVWKTRSFKPRRDEDIDVGVATFTECRKSDTLCHQVYCDGHRTELACKDVPPLGK